MSTIQIDASLKQQLLGLKEATPMVDVDGHVVGIFKPKCQVDAELYAMAVKVFDPEELDRIEREESGKGVPYSEVKKRLQELERQR